MAQRPASAKEILNRGGIKGDDSEHAGHVTIHMYIPGWGTRSGNGEVTNVEVGKSQKT